MEYFEKFIFLNIFSSTKNEYFFFHFKIAFLDPILKIWTNYLKTQKLWKKLLRNFFEICCYVENCQKSLIWKSLILVPKPTYIYIYDSALNIVCPEYIQGKVCREYIQGTKYAVNIFRAHYIQGTIIYIYINIFIFKIRPNRFFWN